MTWSQYLNNELRFLNLTAEELKYHINKFNQQLQVLSKARLLLQECQNLSHVLIIELDNEYEKLNDHKHKFIRRHKELAGGSND